LLKEGLPKEFLDEVFTIMQVEYEAFIELEDYQ
jgi:hypothetical protein